MLYEIHMLKNYPATNLNRDDTGAPKTCVFGGCTRGRISSQCLKRSWRTSDVFRDDIGIANLGVRTRHLPDCVINKLSAKKDIPAEYLEPLKSQIASILKSKKDKETKDKNNKDSAKGITQMAFYSDDDIEATVTAVYELLGKCKTLEDVKNLDISKEMSNAKTRPITLDIALFGRMVTSDSFRNVEAAMQVAHAVSTNRIVMESDYFTAMDDLLSGEGMESSGAAMMDDVDYNSSCYYIYANIDSDALLKNLEYSENKEKLVSAAIPALIRAMAFFNPSGKQNSFAGHVLPSAILIECKEKKTPVSYVNAFAAPVNDKKIIPDSIEKLVAECEMTDRNFGLPVMKRLWFCVDKYEQRAPEGAVVCKTMNELTEAVAETIK